MKAIIEVDYEDKRTTFSVKVNGKEVSYGSGPAFFNCLKDILITQGILSLQEL